jgi:hypothetical protein
MDPESGDLEIGFLLFSSVLADKCRDSTVSHATTVSFHILSISLFIVLSFRDVMSELLTGSLNKLQLKELKLSHYTPRTRLGGEEV